MNVYDKLAFNLLTWSSNFVTETEFQEELLDSHITAAFPNVKMETTNWTVQKVEVYQSLLNRTTLTLHCSIQDSKETYYQRIRVYSPTIPLTRELHELVGAHVLTINPICMVRNPEDERPIVIAKMLKVMKTTGKKINITCQHEDEKGAILDGVDYFLEGIMPDNVTTGRWLTEMEFLSTYFQAKKMPDFLRGYALSEYRRLDEINKLIKK